MKMKKILWKKIIRYIIRQKTACLSMFIVAMLAVTAYLGINYSASAMKDNGERYWNSTAFRDIEIVSPMLLSEKDIGKIAETEGVKETEAVWYVSANVASEKETGVDVISLTEHINTVILEEGRLPETAGECLLERPVLEELKLSVGDTLELKENEVLIGKHFTICGVAKHADHACLPLHVPGNRYAIVKREAFDLDKLQGRCMKAVVRIEGTEGLDRFSDDYLKKCGHVSENLNHLSEQLIEEQLPWDQENILQSIMMRAMAKMNGVRPWLVFDVWGSSHYYAIRSAAENVADMGITFAVVFVIVGALVIYASINRMVEEERVLIGTAKAMGVTGKEIAFKYLVAGIVPTLTGMAAGTLAAYTGIQRILLSIYGRFYVYGKGLQDFRPLMTIIVLILVFLIALVAATAASLALLRKPAVSLMNDRLSRSFNAAKTKQIRKKAAFGLSLYTRMILRNIRLEKRRIIVIVAGIAGCIVLLVTGFTIKLAVAESLDRQFSDVELYDLKISFSPATEDDNSFMTGKIRSVLNETGINENATQRAWIEIYDRNCFFTAGGRMNGGELICGDLEKLADYFVMTDVKNGKSMEHSSEPGVYIHLRTSETTGLIKGDSLILYDCQMNPVNVMVLGVFNNYVGGQMIMSTNSYETIFGQKPENNCFLVKCEKDCFDTIEEKLNGFSVTVTEMEKQKEEYKSYTSALNMIAGLMTGIAALLAGGVLSNLIYLQYYRKKRSLVIMRINGFTTFETVRYVLGESVVTHGFGMILGIAGGSWLGHRIICLMEARQLHIIRNVQPMAWVISVFVMLLFSFVIHAMVIRAVLRLKPTDDIMIR